MPKATGCAALIRLCKTIMRAPGLDTQTRWALTDVLETRAPLGCQAALYTVATDNSPTARRQARKYYTENARPVRNRYRPSP